MGKGKEQKVGHTTIVSWKREFKDVMLFSSESRRTIDKLWVIARLRSERSVSPKLSHYS